MHPNPVYRSETGAANLAYAAGRGFGVLAVNGAEGPLLSHVPFLIDGNAAWVHLVRSNPIARALSEPRPAAIAVSGPHGYVSPDWYGLEDQVPTWNYVAVHLRGRLERRPDAELRGVIDRQSAHFEALLQPKTPWTTDKMTPAALDRLMRAILPCRLEIETCEGTWKLNQNKPAEARLAAARQMELRQLGVETGALADLMRGA